LVLLPTTGERKKLRKILAGVFSGLFLVLALTICSGGCQGEPPRSAEKPKVAATIFPLYDIVRNIAGDKMEVVLILPPGASPHTIELTPQHVRRLENSRLVFRIGHGLDDWTGRFTEFLEDGKAVIVDEGVELVSAGEEQHGQEDGHAHNGVNPHYWLSVKNAQIIADHVLEKLIEVDAQNEQTYRNQAALYKDRLQHLELELKQQLEPFQGEELITFHDSWVYYAREFDLVIVGNIEPFPGRQPTPRYLASLQEQIRRYDIRVLFSEPQLSSESVEAFVADLGLELYVLDPIGGVAGRESYIDLMKYNTNTIVEALSHGRE